MSPKEPGAPEEDLAAVEQRLAVQRLFAGLPDQYEERYAALRKLRTVFYDELGRALEPALRNHVRLQPQTTHSDRSALTAALTEATQGLGLYVECPGTSEPAEVVSLHSGESSANRYRFLVRSPDGQRRATVDCVDLPPIRLIQRDLTSQNSLYPLFPWRRPSGSGGPSR